MNQKSLITASLLVCFAFAKAQTPKKAVPTAAKPKKEAAPVDPVIMTIAEKPITKSEFLAIYNKNNKEASKDPKAIQDYLQLFINFKLKVKEAEEMGLDTLQSFKNELEGYRKQLAQPYLVDNEVNEQLLKEAYNRLKSDIRASHILVNCKADALPKDTLIAYNKAIDARNKLLKGDNFSELAKRVSDDPSAKENGGDLGYFSALQMVYPFESACFNSKVNDVTMPIRTKFGYHVIKITDKRDAQGQITVAHIMIKANSSMNVADSSAAKNKIDEIYKKLKSGENFSELASQFSDDKGSAKRGGELPMFGTGRMVAEFERASFGIKKDGDFTEPVLTQYGWHIIKRISKKEMGSFDEMKAELKAKIAKDSRSQKSKDSMIAKIKKEYGFSETPNSKAEFVPTIDSTFFAGNWKSDKASKLTKNLFKLGDKQFTQKDFTKYLESHQSQRLKIDTKILVDDMYNSFVSEKCLAYEEEKIPSKNAEYRALMQEYRDGILLFDLTDKKVWTMAVKDTNGLKNFYQENKSKYMWEQRTEATVYTCKNDSIANAVKNLLNPPPAPVVKKKKKGETEQVAKPLSEAEILSLINKNSQLNLKIEHAKFTKGENEGVDKTAGKIGLSENMNINKQVVFVNVEKILAPENKTLSEARGIVTADYQNVLEKEWLNGLKNKYKVQINEEVVSSIK
jgi:peptidyl-prolyl cis-trans isomerase SurA